MTLHSITVAGGPVVERPRIPPPLPENPDLSGLRNLVEEAIDDKERARPKANRALILPPGVNAGDLLIWDGAAWIVLAKPAGLAILVAGADGIPVWLAAATKGVLIGNGTSLAWLPSGPAYSFLVVGEDDVPHWWW